MDGIRLDFYGVYMVGLGGGCLGRCVCDWANGGLARAHDKNPCSRFDAASGNGQVGWVKVGCNYAGYILGVGCVSW